MHWSELVNRIVPILAFLLCISVVAELAARVGLFEVVATGAARLCRGSVLGLWLAVVVLSTVATIFLSLDTTAVLMTPVVLALAEQLALDRALFAYTTVWLANTASLLLPVSNLTNLLSRHVLGSDVGRFAALLWPAALAAVLVTVGLLALLFRRSLRGRYSRPPRVEVADRPLLAVAAATCLALLPALALGVNIVLAAGGAALVLVVACLVRRPGLLSLRLVPWPLIVGVTVLFTAVQYAHEHGLGTLLGVVAGHGSGVLAGYRLSGVAALSANLVDNLPAYLALEPVGASAPVRMVALLVGVNAGPLVTPWASLATLLWAGRCRAAGVPISWRRFALRGLLLVPLVVAAATGVTWLAHG